jgi:hypothetical protein
MYRVHCATGCRLPLAMSTQSVDRAADGTAVCGSSVSVIICPTRLPSFGNLNNITKRNLTTVLPVCPLHDTRGTYHVHSATGVTLPMAMSKQPVDRPADCTEYFRSTVSVICEGINWFDSSSVMVAV